MNQTLHCFMQIASVVSYLYVLITHIQPLIFTPLSYMVVIRQLHMYETDAVQPSSLLCFQHTCHCMFLFMDQISCNID